MECSPPGSSIHGIFQARVLERGAIAFSDYASPGRHVLDPKDETQELSGQAASDRWPPKAAHLIPAERGVFRPAQRQAEGLDWAILG